MRSEQKGCVATAGGPCPSREIPNRNQQTGGPISRARWLGPWVSICMSIHRWLWVVALLLVAGLLYLTFPGSPDPNKPNPPLSMIGWLSVLGFLGVFPIALLLLWLVNRFAYRWLRIAQRPWEELLRGHAVAADRAYDKALCYAKSYPLTYFRRGAMLRELGVFLMDRGRQSEARAVFDETVAILERHAANCPLDYIMALNNLALFLMRGRQYQAAQETLERALDLSPTIKRANIQSLEMELFLRLNLVFLFTRMNYLDEAKLHLAEAQQLLDTLGRRSRNGFQGLFLAARSLLNCAAGQYEAAENDIALGPNAGDLLWAKAKVHLARREYFQAEQILRKTIGEWEKLGTSHRPENLDLTLDLAEALFGQANHDIAFASLQEARSIVADFALPPDAAWRKTLEAWLQRARELGKADVAASLETELTKIPVTANQAVTILEKFRIHPQAAE
jgi:tetratricopeptide (TPR) repeat protein